MSELSKVRLHQLFQLAQHLLVLEPNITDGTELLTPFKGVFGITAICLFDARTETVYRIGSATPELESLTRNACLSGKDNDDPASAITIRCIRANGRITAVIAFKGLKDPEQTVEPLIALVAALYERTRLRRQLGDEFKNRLTAILAAAGGLREAGPLSPVQLEMARMVEEEASRLGNLISWVDRIARLDQGEIQPRVDTTNLTMLTAQAVQQYTQKSPEREITFANRGEVCEVLADADLILVALGQVLDFVSKQAATESSVTVEIAAREAFAVVEISSHAGSLSPLERDRVFEPLYGGTRARSAWGEARAGLYQAREIALAHGGTLDFDPKPPERDRLCVLFSLPRVAGPAKK